MEIKKLDERRLKKGQALVTTKASNFPVIFKRRKKSGRGFETVEITVGELIDKYFCGILYLDEIFEGGKK